MRRKKNRIKNRNCDNCRYKNCSYELYPCRDGLEQKLTTGKCGLWEPQLRIQKLVHKILEMRCFDEKRKQKTW